MLQQSNITNITNTNNIIQQVNTDIIIITKFKQTRNVYKV